jgi:hypothetical protein
MSLNDPEGMLARLFEIPFGDVMGDRSKLGPTATRLDKQGPVRGDAEQGLKIARPID